MTAQHTLNNTVEKGFNQMAHCNTRHRQICGHNKHTHTNKKAATDQHSRHIHEVHRKLGLDQGTQSLHIHTTSILKLAYLKVSSSHPHYLTYTLPHLPAPRLPVQVRSYADDITITSTPTSMRAAKKYIQPCLHIVFGLTKHNNITPNLDKTTGTLFTPNITEFKNHLDLKINNTALSMARHPEVLGLTLYPKLSIQHTLSQHLITRIQTSTNNKITHRNSMGGGTEAHTRGFLQHELEYASSIWSPHTSNRNTTSITSPTQTYNILQHSKAKKNILTTDATKQTFPQTRTQLLQQT